MEKKSDVVIISAFGRGHWLASELLNSGLQVTIVDVTECIGKWSSEDWEGPFGVFHNSALTQTQLNCLKTDASLEEIPNGVTIWLPQGPVETASLMTAFLLEKEGLDPSCVNYIHQASVAQELSSELQTVRGLEFQRNWICQLAHQISSTVYESNADAIRHGRPVDFFSTWSIRRPTGFQDSLQSLEQQGARVHTDAQLIDLGLNGSTVEGVEIKSKWSGIVQGEQFVWMMSSEDALRFPAGIRTKLFTWGHIESEWSWVRFRIDIPPVANMLRLPAKMIMIQNVFCPWTHVNLTILQQTKGTQFYDAWIRIPTQLRFQRSYLEKMGAELTEFVAARIPGTKCKILQWPADYNFDYRDLGAPRFPVFSRAQLQKFRPAPLRNLHFAGPEFWENLDWSARFRRQTEIAQKILRVWRKQQDRERRRTPHSEVNP